MSSNEKQVAEGEEREQVRPVLGQPAIARLRTAELPLDHPERNIYTPTILENQ